MNHSTSFLSFAWRALLALGLAMLALGAHADPKDDIKADMVAGRWPQAEERLTEVLKKHPDNALAFYWYAQVLEKQGKTSEARDALANAERLAPNERFAGNREQLAQMKARLGVGAPTITAAAETPAVVAPSVVPAPEPRREPVPEPEHRSGGMFWVFVAAGVLLVVLVMVSRRSGSAGLKQERERWASELNDASKDLADAQLVSDANPALSEAQRLSNYDRIRLVKSDLSAHQSSLASRSDFGPTQALVLRARDLAAELRGEERPSERLRREQQEQLDREAQVAAARGQGQGYGPGYGPGYGQPTAGGSLLRDAAMIGGGAVLGSILAGSASAHERRDDRGSAFGGGSGSLHEVDDDQRFGRNDGGGIDVGGSDAGFDFGGSDSGSDVGGGGSDDFS
ncbi:tetratricopeptide repeat protein [Paucibacter sp. R3-3]|uniref:Tetratricopeptide repeat protein n=1 Tax=Roseateles agri TaxID=3098619 RepID=A0ABU5DPU5_9BURK|nr:tetratricopeptide repeat protein [Paucibacter sp. R3-3]MDY0748345.1 tetratricopeptide repeat protein [Paucibacter sp. R3-3]